MKLVEVYRTWNEPKAEQIKALLVDNGIDCYLSSHITQSVWPISVDGLGEIRVMVPEEFEERSHSLLENYFPPEDSQADGSKSDE